jgi:hypothetical protein
MSDETISLVITIAIIALFFAWVPFLELVCPPCARFLERQRLQKNSTNKQYRMETVKTLRDQG